MADISSDGTTRVWWVLTISNTSAPTVAELNAGVALETYITPDGWAPSVSTDAVDSGSLASKQNTKIVGRRNDEVSVTFKDQGESVAPFATFNANPNGYLVSRRNLPVTTAPAAGQKVTVRPVQAGYRNPAPSAVNELSKVTVPFMITGDVIDNATVA